MEARICFNICITAQSWFDTFNGARLQFDSHGRAQRWFNSTTGSTNVLTLQTEHQTELRIGSTYRDRPQMWFDMCTP